MAWSRAPSSLYITRFVRDGLVRRRSRPDLENMLIMGSGRVSRLSIPQVHCLVIDQPTVDPASSGENARRILARRRRAGRRQRDRLSAPENLGYTPHRMPREVVEGGTDWTQRGINAHRLRQAACPPGSRRDPAFFRVGICAPSTETGPPQLQRRPQEVPSPSWRRGLPSRRGGRVI